MNDIWLYQQLFHEPGEDGKVTDEILLGYVAPTAKALIKRGWIDRFFFLRYSERGFHLRYRLRMTDSARCKALMTWLGRRISQLVVPPRVAYATYEPEVAKYGGPEGIDPAERQFFASSKFALACLSRTRGHLSLRIIVAVCALDLILRLSGIERKARLSFLEAYSRNWYHFCGQLGGQLLPRPVIDPLLVKRMAKQLQTEGQAVDFIKHVGGSAAPTWIHSLRTDLAELRELDCQGRLESNLPSILGNLAHTLNNRLGLGPLDEVLVADLLSQIGLCLREVDSGNPF